MRPPSQTAISLVETLRRPRGAVERLGGSREAVAAADQIVAQPEATLAPYLLFAFEESGVVGFPSRLSCRQSGCPMSGRPAMINVRRA